MLFKINSPSDDKVLVVGEMVKRGQVIIYPSDTLYGIGCDPRNREAVERVMTAKRRDGKPMPLLVSSLEWARSAVELGRRGEALARRFWPGPLTIAAPARAGFPKELVSTRGKVGVRVPDHKLLLAIIKASGGALVGTSANISGRGAARSVEELDPELVKGADLVVDGGPVPVGKPSTVVEVGWPVPDGLPEVADGVWLIRAGAIGVEVLKNALGFEGD